MEDNTVLKKILVLVQTLCYCHTRCWLTYILKNNRPKLSQYSILFFILDDFVQKFSRGA